MTPPSRPRRPHDPSRTVRNLADNPRGNGGRSATTRRSSHARQTGKEPSPGPLTTTQRRYLRGLCHGLKPVLMLGNKGVTDNVMAELGRTLDDHELVKIKLSGGDRGERQQQLDALLETSGAELVQQIGHVASLFRRNPDKPGLALPT